MMGVMMCNRNGCEETCCDRYSDKHGYICPECFIELIDSGVSTDIKEFMDSEKHSELELAKETASFRYDRIFTLRDD